MKVLNHHLHGVNDNLSDIDMSLLRIADSLERLVAVVERTEVAVRMPLVYIARVFRS